MMAKLAIALSSTVLVLLLGAARLPVAPPQGESPDVLVQLTDLPGNETEVVFAPDGGRIAFTSDARGNLDVRVLDLAGRDVVDLAATDANEREPRWSPDGGRIAFISDAGGATALWLADAAGGQPRRLTDAADRALRPRWSPDGRWIAFLGRAGGDDQVWVVRPDGSGKRQLSRGPGEYVPYGWSPDGLHVLAVRFADTQDVYGLPLDGGTPIQITTRQGEEWWPQWSPSGGQVVFYSTWDDEMTEIWTADSATRALTRITDQPVEDFRPSWSPDGAWISYSSDRVSKSGVWLASADGAITMPVATTGRSGGSHSWSPDGRNLAFSYLVTKDSLHSVALNGGDGHALTDGSQTVVEAVTSPDGRFIAFEAEDVGTEADLYVLEVASGAIRRVTNEITYNARPSWSPDGTRLTFERSLGGGPRTLRVGVVDLDRGTVSGLTEHGYVRQPVWCDEHIVYTREHSRAGEGAAQLWMVGHTGGAPVQLTTGAGDKRTTDCSATATVLYTVDEGSGPVQWQARIDSGRLVDRVALGPGEGGRWSPDESRVALLSARDGSPDLYVVPRNGGDTTRVTDSPLRESWPDWLGDELIFSANVGGRDIWMADIETILARAGH